MDLRALTLPAILFALFYFLPAPVSADLGEPLKPKSGFDMQVVERGRYLVKVAGCNDCHTAGYLMTEGKTPVSDWLTGDVLGWKGPWGTTYSTNLRLAAQPFNEDQWVLMAKNLRRRPPMPWFNLNVTKDEDLRAMYQFLRYLGPAGKPAPDYVPPGKEPTGPYATFPEPPQK